MRKKTEQTFILVPAKPVTRPLVYHPHSVLLIFGQYNLRKFWIPSVLGFCAGGKKDLLPARNERELDTLIKSLKST